MITIIGLGDHDAGLGDQDRRIKRSRSAGLSDQDGPDYALADSEGEDTDIRRLMQVSGDIQAMQQAMIAMADQLRQLTPELPDEFFDELKVAVLSDELFEMLVPVYARHFTHDEILQIIEFYEGPVGKKLVQRLPLIQQDAMGVGQRWAQKKGLEITESLRERGLLPSEPSADDAEE